MKSGAGPAVLECVTYRHMAHSAPLFDDAQGYREEDVLEKRQEKDSVTRLKRTLMKQGVTEAAFVEIENIARTQALEAIRHAEVSPYPPKEDLYTHLYV